MSLHEAQALPQAQQNIMFTMGQLNRQWRRVVDRLLRPLGLTEATWLPLTHLERATAPMRQKDLAASLGLDSSSVVRLLDGLETAGLIVRAGHVDRRAKTIDITPKGLEIVRQVKALINEERLKLFADVSDEQLTAAFAVLQNIGGQLHKLEQGDAGVQA